VKSSIGGWSMPKQFPVEFRQRALRLLAEARQYQQYETEWAAIQAVSSRLGVNSETLRKWLRRSEVDAGTRPGTTSEELAEIRRLKKENAELRRTNEILRTASAFFAAELDRPASR
jgi:transposase